jgi:hypothetical protein
MPLKRARCAARPAAGFDTSRIRPPRQRQLHSQRFAQAADYTARQLWLMRTRRRRGSRRRIVKEEQNNDSSTHPDRASWPDPSLS